jgi:ribosomal protein L11 methyltransferase
MQYIETVCTLPDSGQADVPDIVVALLAELGYESFETTDNAVKAYVSKELYDADALAELSSAYPALISRVKSSEIEPENYNSVWESNSSMTVIADRCVIYAPFHTDIPDLPYKICIMPHMTFGTGHHETTSLMVELLLDINIANKNVLDMGCGTGILAILASVGEASSVMAVDTDEWAYRNTIENCERNNAGNVKVLQGDGNLLHDLSFDLILANINRNVLLKDIPTYVTCLNDGGYLQMSGFYTEDLPDITAEAERCGCQYLRHIVKNNWVAVQFKK